MRRIATIDEIIDIMSSIKGGCFTTLCYLSSAEVKKTRREVNVGDFMNDLEATRDELGDDIYNTMSDYGQGKYKKFPYGGVVKMQSYQLHWQSDKKYRQNFHDYALKRDALLAKYGAEIKKRGGYDQQVKYGQGGTSVGSTEKTMDRNYEHQNEATSKTLSKDYYLIDLDGNMIGAIPYESIKSIVTKEQAPDGVAALRRVNATDAQIQEYLEELKKLNFKILKMSYDSILFVITKFNGEGIYYINTNLAKKIGSGSYTVNINPQEFINKANEMFAKTNREMNAEVLREQKLMKMLAEGKKSRGKKVLSEIKSLFERMERTSEGSWSTLNEEAEEEYTQRDVSYGELAALQDEFEKQCEERKVEFPDEETRSQCLFDFVQQYIDGDDDPQVMICFEECSMNEEDGQHAPNLHPIKGTTEYQTNDDPYRYTRPWVVKSKDDDKDKKDNK